MGTPLRKGRAAEEIGVGLIVLGSRGLGPVGRLVMGSVSEGVVHHARMAASGLFNREIGHQLYLSHRTISAHLYHNFPNLGVTSRGQLRDALDPALA